MKTALVFPGQGSQFPGMGKDLYDASEMAREMFHKANEILGFDIAKVMFEGTQEDLKKTSVTQPAIYIHSVALARVLGMDKEGQMAAGHSLGEFSALAVAGALSFEDGLRLVSIRANAMQKACNAQRSTMAAVIGMEDAVVEAICAEAGEVVVPANYNSPGQLVISGTLAGVEKAIELLKARGARLVKPLVVDGAFHSPVMEPARAELAEGIASTPFADARIPVYQNATATPHTAADAIRQNLIAQLTAPVRWTQSVEAMVADGASRFIEIGPGNVLQGLVKRIAKDVAAEGKQSL